MYPHSFSRADLLFEANESRPDIDVECQGSIIHENEKQTISDSDRSTALASMNIEVLWITHEKISNASTFQSIAGLIARRIDYPLPRVNRRSTQARERTQTKSHDRLVDARGPPHVAQSVESVDHLTAGRLNMRGQPTASKASVHDQTPVSEASPCLTDSPPTRRARTTSPPPARRAQAMPRDRRKGQPARR